MARVLLIDDGQSNRDWMRQVMRIDGCKPARRFELERLRAALGRCLVQGRR